MIVSLFLILAVEFGKVEFTGVTQEEKYAGCGKVIKVYLKGLVSINQ